MNTRGLPRHRFSTLLITCAVLALLLSACQPAAVPTSIPTVQPTVPAVETETPTATQSLADVSGEITLDLSGVAENQSVETVPAVPAGPDQMWWAPGPEYRRMTLQGYPDTANSIEPQIFIYPAAELAEFNEEAGKMAAALQALLQAKQPVENMPFLPLYNSLQLMHAQDQYLDFKNGKGVRFLTQFNQGPVKVNNEQLVYTFQGLTDDGKYYIAAVLPVTHPELPDTQEVFDGEPENYRPYVAETVTWLEQQPSSSFTPDLAKLDALIQSIEVK